MPHGSNLGYMLFIWFINDVWEVFQKFNFLFFAEDLRLFRYVDEISGKEIIDSVLRKFIKWWEGNECTALKFKKVLYLILEKINYILKNTK